MECGVCNVCVHQALETLDGTASTTWECICELVGPPMETQCMIYGNAMHSFCHATCIHDSWKVQRRLIVQVYGFIDQCNRALLQIARNKVIFFLNLRLWTTRFWRNRCRRCLHDGRCKDGHVFARMVQSDTSLDVVRRHGGKLRVDVRMSDFFQFLDNCLSGSILKNGIHQRGGQRIARVVDERGVDVPNGWIRRRIETQTRKGPIHNQPHGAVV